MKVLIAEDDPLLGRYLRNTFAEWGYDVIGARDGEEAWEYLQDPAAPRLAILDWILPKMEGVEVCKKLRQRPTQEPVYVIILTGKGATADIVEGLQSGANDYITKPFEPEELRARVQVGFRVVELQRSLAARVHEVEEALEEIKRLRWLLPICTYCKRIRNDQNYWEQVEQYLAKRSEVQFSHGICPECWKKEVEPQLKELDQNLEGYPYPGQGIDGFVAMEAPAASAKQPQSLVRA